VISIIALLIGILLPVLGSTRAAARNVQCLSNLKQWGIALAIYVTENNGYMPSEHPPGTTSPADDTNKGRWYNALPPQVGLLEYHEVFAPGTPEDVFTEQNIWWCPEARKESGKPTATGTGRSFDYTWSYVLNGTNTYPPNYDQDHVRIDSVPTTSDTLVISEPSGRDEGISINNLDPDRHADRNINILFLDSHVAGVNAEDANTLYSGPGEAIDAPHYTTAEGDVVWGPFR